MNHNPFATYLQQLNEQDPSLSDDLSQMVEGIKMSEATKINDKGVLGQLQYLHSQGIGYDEILMNMGLTVQQAHALIEHKNLYPPRLQEMRQWLNRLHSQGYEIGKLVDHMGRVVDVGFIDDMGPGFNRHYDRGATLSCSKSRILATDLHWLSNEPWWEHAPEFRLNVSRAA